MATASLKSPIFVVPSAVSHTLPLLPPALTQEHRVAISPPDQGGWLDSTRRGTVPSPSTPIRLRDRGAGRTFGAALRGSQIGLGLRILRVQAQHRERMPADQIPVVFGDRLIGLVQEQFDAAFNAVATHGVAPCGAAPAPNTAASSWRGTPR